MISHIDLDVVTYRVGNACDGKYWMYKGDKWTSKASLNVQLKKDGVTDAACTVHKDPEPWSQVERTLVSFVDSIIDRIGAHDYLGHLSGNSNFRYDVATILPYKGKRSSLTRPFHYDAIRQYLVDYYDAQVSVGMEADDTIGLAHDPERDVIASPDKDLNCIPGLHYNWNNDECYYVTEIDADRNFFKQMLIGDLSTDNILGLYGIGESSAYVKAIYKMTDPEDMRDHVFYQYIKRFGNYAEQFFQENAKLLWILQRRECPING